MNSPRLLQTFLLDGTMEGARIIELLPSAVKAFAIPRIELNSIKHRPETTQPALYLLINSSDNQLYIGESEAFYTRIRNHDQSKDFWDIAVAVVSTTNSLEKSDVKFLESLAVEKAIASSAMTVLNKTVPPRNNVHEFKVHTLNQILEDTALIAESLGYSVFKTRETNENNDWYINLKKTAARGEFRGNKMIILAGSKIDPSYSERWATHYPKQLAIRTETLQKSADLIEGVFVLNQNIPFSSPSQSSGFATGRNSNGWTEWKNSDGRTMDEVIRKGDS